MAYKNKSSAIKYNNDFISKAYDRINLTIPKGQKEIIQAAASDLGLSVNNYIFKAILAQMERDAQELERIRRDRAERERAEQERLAREAEEKEAAERKTITNGDKIRQMTDYDLADFLCAIVSCCGNGACGEFCPLWKCCNDQASDNIENWLKQEVTE